MRRHLLSCCLLSSYFVLYLTATVMPFAPSAHCPVGATIVTAGSSAATPDSASSMLLIVYVLAIDSNGARLKAK
jgi:hypothetical protein